MTHARVTAEMRRTAAEWKVLRKALPEPLKSIAEMSVTRGMRRTAAEWKVLRKALPEPLKSIAEMSVTRGMRLGEILALQWTDVDFIRDEISMRDTKGNRPRVIPMEGARAVLERQAKVARLTLKSAQSRGTSPRK